MIDTEALKNVEELHRLKAEGIITEAEFEQAKQRILFTPGAAIKTYRTSSEDVPFPAVNDGIGWVLLPLKRYADFQGRSGRKEFWMFQVLSVLIAIGIFSAFTGWVVNDFSPTSFLSLLFIFAACCGLAIPQLAVEVRRFHDQDKTGWFVLLNFIPYIGPVIVFVMMLLEGTPGDNQYGPKPPEK